MENGYLIARGDESNPEYLTVSRMSGLMAWTHDAAQALHLHREADAELMLIAAGDANLRVVPALAAAEG